MNEISIFENIKQDSQGDYFWSARDLQEVLGYAKWEKFQIKTAKG